MARQGEGSVYRSAEGGWIAALDVPARSGRRRIRKKRRAKTRSEAQRLLRQMRHEFDATGSVSAAQRWVSDTVAGYWEVRNDAELAKSTKDGTRWMLDLLHEGLGGVRLDRLTVTDCDDFLKACSRGLDAGPNGKRRPVGREHLKRVRSTLVAAIKNDMRLGYVRQNVAELSVMPNIISEPADRRSLTLDELSRLHASATGALGILVDLSGRNGLRPAEARGLLWSNVDFNQGQISIEGQLNEDDELVPAKTKEAYRTLSIDATSIERLAAWSEQQGEYRSANLERWTDLGLVATTRHGTPISRNNYARSIRSLCRKVGIEDTITPYELRHTAISHQAERGYSSWQLADWAGTSERMIADRYRHKLQAVVAVQPVEVVDKRAAPK